MPPSNAFKQWQRDGSLLLFKKLSIDLTTADEVDSLLGKRRDNEHEATTSMKTEFMQLWDGFETEFHANVMVLAATNRPWDLDEAVLRRYSKFLLKSYRVAIVLPKAQSCLLSILSFK